MSEPIQADRIAEMIASVSSAVEGDLSVRIPLTEDRDDLTALAYSVNRLIETLEASALERTQSEAALEERREALRRLEANIPGMVYLFALTPEGTVSFPYVNAGSLPLFGIEPKDLMNDSGTIYRLIHPDDRRRLDEAVERSAQTLEPFREEIRHIVEGEVRWYDIMSRPERREDGKTVWDGILLEITDRKRMEDKLRMFQASVDQASDAIFWIDRNGRFTYVNDQACTALDYTREEMLGLSLWDIDPDFPRERWDEKWNNIDAVSITTHESRHRRKDGSIFPVEISAKHFRFDRSELHVAFVRDITERKKAEEERVEMERRFLHTQKLESLGVLSGGIAHDFNNLLMAILGNLELTKMKLSPVSPVRDMIEEALKASLRATDLTRQLLAYSGRGRFIVENMHLSELAEENAHLLKSSISKSAILHLRLDKGIPGMEADAGQIQQVVMNLITNASEAIGENHGMISLSTGVMDCDADDLKQTRLDETPEPGRFVYVEVSDTGCGMNPETEQRLFDPFFTTKATGRGLGMSAILGIVKGHKGAVMVDSVEHEGTTIRVFFPAAELVRPEPGALRRRSTDRPREAETARLDGTVLVVDDEEVVRKACKRILEYIGLSVVTANDGEEAVETFRERGDEIDCVILDLSMPRMDGITALKELLEIDPEAKVLLSSGYDDQDSVERLSREGLAGFIHKPYEIKTLRSALEGIL